MRAELIRFVLFYFPPNQPATIYESRMQFIHFLLNTAAVGLLIFSNQLKLEKKSREKWREIDTDY